LPLAGKPTGASSKANNQRASSSRARRRFSGGSPI